MKRSRPDLSIDKVIVIDSVTYKNSQMKVFHCFTFKPKTGLGLTKTGVSYTFIPKIA